MSRVRVTANGLNELQAVLENASDEVVPRAKKLLSKTALEVKKSAQRKASGISHAPHYPRSITYDTHWVGTTGRAEIGPDKDRRQGALGNILEYGTVNNPPYAHLGPALDYEGPVFEQYAARLVEDLLT